MRHLRARVPGWTGGDARRSTVSLVLFVGAGFIDRDTTEIFGEFDQTLVTVVPLGAGFVEKHAALVGPSELHETSFADVGTQPAGVFQVLVIGVFRIAKALDQFFQFVALQGPGIHRKEGHARRLASSTKSFQPSVLSPVFHMMAWTSS